MIPSQQRQRTVRERRQSHECAYAERMIPRYALCNGGRRDGKRYPLHREIRPGYEFTWDGSTYRVIRQVIETNAGPMWVARAAEPRSHAA